jgi:hypothetical protein
MKRKSLDEQNFNSGKDLNFFKDRKRINIQFDSDNFKKPGTSIEKVKPSNIFPKIGTMKIPSSTACNIVLEDDFLAKYKNKNGKINIMKRPINEINKEEYINYHKTNTINDKIINKNQNNPIIINNDNNPDTEKKSINKVVVDINKYKDICINILTNNIDLNKKFTEIYNNKINTKKWVENNLFGREVFKIRLEAYIKNKTDVLSFIKKEIEKIINNEYCDYIFSKSFKQIESQYNEHMKYIENL